MIYLPPSNNLKPKLAQAVGSTALLRSIRRISKRCILLQVKIRDQLLVVSISYNVLLGWNSEEAFKECLGISNVLSFVACVEPFFVPNPKFSRSLWVSSWGTLKN